MTEIQWPEGDRTGRVPLRTLRRKQRFTMLGRHWRVREVSEGFAYIERRTKKKKLVGFNKRRVVDAYVDHDLNPVSPDTLVSVGHL